MSDCIFCKIAAGEIPSDKVYEDKDILAFRDIHPKAPVHILVIPKKHLASLNEVAASDETLLGRMMTVLRDLANDQGVSASGYRVLSNCGPDGGQEVDHLHFHLLGGRKLGPLG